MRAHKTVGSTLPCLCIALALVVATWWALRVPLFQQPDEAAHADDAFALYDAGQWFRIPKARPGRDVTREVRYLKAVSAYRTTRYNPDAAFPADYGTLAYIRRIDAKAPRPSGRVPRAHNGLPYVMFAYPIGYYATIAVGMRLVYAAGHSLVIAFFAARLFSVVCLAVTLALAWFTLRALRLERRTAVAALTAIGLFPLTSWMSGYVQPDNLTALLVTLCLYVSVRLTRHPDRPWLYICLGLALGTLAFVKEHFAVAAIVPTLALALTRRRVNSHATLRLSVAVAVILPIIAFLFSTRLVPVSHLLPHPAFAWAARDTRDFTLTQRIFDVAASMWYGLLDTYAGGDAFRDFWVSYGFRGTSIFPAPFVAPVVTALCCATTVVILSLILRQRIVFGRLVTIARRRSILTAVRLLCADVVLNVYLSVTAVLLAAYALSRGAIWLEGRYWFPVILPTMLLGVRTLPRVWKAAHRHAIAFGAALVWLTYSVLGTPLALATMEHDFYGTHPRTPARERFAGIDQIIDRFGNRYAGRIIRISRPTVLIVRGNALDSQTGFPARRVYLDVDGRARVWAQTRLPSLRWAMLYNDDALLRSGFLVRLDSRRLGPGRHLLGLEVIERRAPSGLTAGEPVTVFVRPSVAFDCRRRAGRMHSTGATGCLPSDH